MENIYKIKIFSDDAFILAQNLCRKGVKNDPIREPLAVFYITLSQAGKQILLFTQAENIFPLLLLLWTRSSESGSIYSNSVNKN